MKKFARKIVLILLKWMAKRRLKKFHGKTIGVTGSVGKTTTKEAIFTVLNSQYRVKRSEKSMNSEFGLLLTILDIDSGFSSAPKWAWLLTKAFFYSFFRDTSEILLVEMGVDKPGDMDFLLSVVKPEMAVFTNVATLHIDEGQFKNEKEIFEEKSKLIEALPEKGIAVLNIDNPYVDSLAGKCRDKKPITYGLHEGADYRAEKIESALEGLKFELVHKEERVTVSCSVIGSYQVYAILPAIICGINMGMSMENAVAAVERFKLPAGRLSVIPGIKESTILDASYNSSPESLKETLKVLKELGGKRRKVAVIGNMNELGERSEELHLSIGEIIGEYADYLVTVGAKARLIGEKAAELGFDKKNVHDFKTASEAAEFFKKKIQKDDLVLVKGSQNNVRLEKFVKEIMLHPEDARELLVRQEKVWLDKM